MVLFLMIGIVVGDASCGNVPVAALFVVIGVVLMSQYFIRKMYILHSCALMFTSFLIGMLLVILAERRLDVGLSKAEVEYEAVLTSQPDIHGKVVMCDLLVTKYDGITCRNPFCVKASILRDTVEGRYEALSVGDGIMAYSRLFPPENYYMNSNFDYVRWLKVRGFVAQTFIFHDNWQLAAVNISTLSRFERAQIKAMALRQRLIGYYKALGIKGQQQSVVAAMTLGDKSQLSNEISDAYSISGTSHILALSGSNLSIIFTMLLFLFPWRKLRVLSRCAILVAIWLYVVLVGMEASVLRAAVMLSVYSFATLLNRDNVSLNALFLTVAIMLVCNPLDLWDAGFQMSFMAVLSMFVFFKPIYHALPPRIVNKFLPIKWAWAVLVMSIAAQVGVAPLVLYYFGRFPCYFLLANLVVIPMSTIILYSTFAILVSTPFPVIQEPMAFALSVFTRWLNSYVEWIASLPGASIEDIHVGGIQVLLVYLLIAAVSFLVYRLRRDYRASLI